MGNQLGVCVGRHEQTNRPGFSNSNPTAEFRFPHQSGRTSYLNTTTGRIHARTHRSHNLKNSVQHRATVFQAVTLRELSDMTLTLCWFEAGCGGQA